MVRRLLPLSAVVVMVIAGLVGPAASSGASSSRQDWAGHALALREKRLYGYMVGDRARFDLLKVEAAARAARLDPLANPTRPAGVSAPVPGPSWQGVDE